MNSLKTIIAIFLWTFVGINMPNAEAAEPSIESITIRVPESDWHGLYSQVIHAVFAPIGIEMDVQFGSYALVLKQVQEKQVDVALTVGIGQINGVLLSQWPVEIEDVVVVYRNTKRFPGPSKMAGSVGWIRSYGFEASFPNAADIVEFRRLPLALRALESGRIDYLVDYRETVIPAAQTLGMDLRKYKLELSTLLSEPAFPAFANNDRGRIIRDIYDDRMAELKADGTLDQLFAELQRVRYPGQCPNQWCNTGPASSQQGSP